MLTMLIHCHDSQISTQISDSIYPRRCHSRAFFILHGSSTLRWSLIDYSCCQHVWLLLSIFCMHCYLNPCVKFAYMTASFGMAYCPLIVVKCLTSALQVPFKWFARNPDVKGTRCSRAVKPHRTSRLLQFRETVNYFLWCLNKGIGTWHQHTCTKICKHTHTYTPL